MDEKREGFGSRLGFILVAAGCAIGLGNVWRFPFITGQYGGAAFILIYLLFLLVFGFPILVMEFTVGRASRRGVGRAFNVLEKPGHKWHFAGIPMIAGNYLLMMFYTTVTGWMLYYFYRMVTMGDLMGMTPEQVGAAFGDMLGNGPLLCFWMIVAVFLGLSIVALGVKRGVERVTKIMMVALLFIMLLLAVRVLTLPGAGDGLEFYLKPDFAKLKEAGIGKVLFAALGQSFFTLSLGIGSMTIFGSYIGKTHSLPKEAAHICFLDTAVALLAGLIIIPSCFAFGVEPGAGPGLIFATLPNVFAQMPAGRLCGAAFFLFLSFAALSTLVAVFENIIAYWIDAHGVERSSAVRWNFVAIVLLSFPCALGFNVLSGFEPFGAGSCVLDLEDFLVSNTLLPLGALVFVLFCNHNFGWKQKNFLAEANLGKGFNFPTNPVLCFYFKWILPAVIVFILVMGYVEKFAPGLYAKIFG
ncbi:MAG: sodium-dependent transporter [Fibrobacter sp.]|uniref:sodium-dependent transporter n=1 Tax=Fibrobacter sp. TaxID=35828 RepID=UPI0025C00D3B|nr:sodium-dependent transporter [Fibrobacter sp.]MBR4785273.1 sodium-dependent transporter [Fibrobacter sp.]